MFEQNKFTINPAYAGEKIDKTRLSLTSLLIPNESDEASSYFIQGVNLDFSINENIATGTRITYVNQEVFTEFTIDQSFAYKINLNRNQLLSFGLSAGINHTSANFRGGNGGNVYVDQNDPLLKADIDTENNLRMEVGALYKIGNGEFSISVPYLLDSRGLHLGLNSYLGYTFENINNFKLKPSLLLLRTSVDHYSLTGSINAIYREKFWGQLNVTDLNQAVIGFGMQFDNFGVGYNFGKPLNNDLPQSATSHQFGFFTNF